jgi:transposase
MHDVLVIYKQIEMRFDDEGNLLPFEEEEEVVHTLSYDEKPGIQAIAATSDDKLPVPDTGKTSTIMRDYEYVRHGTVSLLAAIDLLTGNAIPLVSDTHKSSDFVCFLKLLDEKYPKGDKIRLILDNHSAHTSKETQEYLNTVSGRFEFVFTPTHGSWLNMIEGFFSKMTRQMLTGIRVKSKEELKERILRYFDEINAVPVPYRWKYRMETIDLEKEDIRQIVYEVVNAKAASDENKGKRAPEPKTRSRKSTAQGTENT